MTKRKSKEQRNNTGSRSGKAKNNHVTLDAEIMQPGNSTPDIHSYPMSFDGEEKRCNLYDALIEASHKTDILKQDTDTMLLEMIVEYWFSWQEARQMLKRDGSIITELNGNTGAEIKKPHPAAKMANDDFNRLMKLLNESGLTRNALARIAEKAAQIKAVDFTNDEQDKHKGGMSMSDWQDGANEE